MIIADTGTPSSSANLQRLGSCPANDLSTAIQSSKPSDSYPQWSAKAASRIRCIVTASWVAAIVSPAPSPSSALGSSATAPDMAQSVRACANPAACSRRRAASLPCAIPDCTVVSTPSSTSSLRIQSSSAAQPAAAKRSPTASVTRGWVSTKA